MHALEGLRVVELAEDVVGPMVGMLLSDVGADVVKVERPDGDTGRARAGFHMWNRGKRSVVLDQAGRSSAALTQLATRADVLIVSDVADLDVWGVRLDHLRDENPGLVVLEVPAWQGPAPWLGGKESAGLLSAAVGLAMNQSSFAGGPVDLVEPQLLYMQAAWAATAALSAVLERDRSGRGQLVTVSGPQAFAVFAPHLLVFEPDSPIGSRALGSGGPNPAYTTYQSADGEWFFVGALPDAMRRRVFDLLDANDILDDPRIAGDTDKTFLPENSWVRERLAAAFATAGREHWLAELERIDVPAAPVLTTQEWLDHPHLKAMGGRVDVEHPRLGPVVMPASPLSFSATPAHADRMAPQVGASSWSDVDWPIRPASPVSATETRGGPLAGVRVISLGAFVAGPFAARLLAELGAEVIKVEPIAGDPWRTHGFHLNDGMRSVAIDLRADRGAAAMRAILDTADVVIDNFRPGVLTRLGIDHEQLSASRPGIVTASITGFGAVGPLAERPGFDPVLGALTGMQKLQGGDDEPVMLSLAVNDTGAATLTALASVIALCHRSRTGEGQHASVSLAATATYLQSETLVQYEGREPVRRGGRDFRGDGAHRCFYESLDGWIRVETDPETLKNVVGADLGVDSTAFIADPHAAITAMSATRRSDDLVARLASVGIAATAARWARDVASDPLFVEAKATYPVELPDGYRYMSLGRLATFDRTTVAGPLRPPGLGEHTRQVLAAAGVTEDEVDVLLREGLAAQGEPMLPRVMAQYR